MTDEGHPKLHELFLEWFQNDLNMISKLSLKQRPSDTRNDTETTPKKVVQEIVVVEN